MILKSPLNYGGRLYIAGENVKGKLPLEMLELLEEKGAFNSSFELSVQEGSMDEPTNEGGDVINTQTISTFGDGDKREVIVPLSQDENNTIGEEMSLSPTRSVAELEEYLKDVKDMEEVLGLLNNEQESATPRSSAIKVLEKRLKELNGDV